MNIIHIMADGTVRKSIEGVVITNEQFYRIANSILEKKRGRSTSNTERNLHTNSGGC